MDENLLETIRKVMELEESPEPDWGQIEKLCTDQIADLQVDEAYMRVDDCVYHFLEDHDIRKKDQAYGARQRELLNKHL